MGQATINLICENPACGKQFIKRLTEFKRSEKPGRQHFCSIRCFAQLKGTKNFKDKANKDTSYLRSLVRTDELSPFRNALKIIKKSVKERHKESDLTLEGLKLVWERQKGICPYTGWELILFPCTTYYKTTSSTPNTASVDRIDSSRGYTIDNIQFVAVIANFAKNAFTEQELLDFCDAVITFRYSYKHCSSTLEASKNYNNNSPLLPIESYQFNSIRDEYSPFRQYLKLANRRAKEKK